MIFWLACGRNPVVAAKAAARDCAMIEADRGPGGCRMAVFTGIGGNNVVVVLAGLYRPIMAGRAGGSGRAVIKADRDPAFGDMAIGALPCCRNVV